MESAKTNLQVKYEEFTSLFHKACDGRMSRDFIAELCLDMKPGDMLHTREFNLHDSMLSIELGDPKMDLKVKLEECVSLEKALADKAVKKPQDLTIQEINGLFDGILGKEILWLQGLSLPHTIYTLAYLYDPKIYEEHQSLKPYLDAMYLGGSYCQELLRHSAYLREDDYVALGVGFLPTKSFEEVNQALVDAEHELEDNLSQKKKKKKKQEETKANLNEYDALDARLRLRRGLLNLYSYLKAKFTAKIRSQVQNVINSCLKALEVVRETLEHSENCDSYFIDSINKSLLIHMPPRKIKTITKQETFDELASMLAHFQTILELSTLRDLYDIQKSLHSFSQLRRHIITRAYLDANVFQNNVYFGEISLKQLALSALEEFAVGKGKKLVTNDQVIRFVEENVPILEEMLSNNLRNRSQQRRKISKTYHNLTAFAQDAYKLDQDLFGKGDEKNHVLFLWVIDFALKLMIRQLLEGFEQKIYADEDHCMIFYFTDHIFSFLDRNFNNVVSKYDKEFLSAWQTKQDLPKKKKKLTEFQKRFFYESLYYKAIQNYIRIMLRLSSIVITKGLIKMPEEQELKSRYYLRLRIFDRAYFLGKNEFEEYQQTVKLVEQKETETLLKEYKGSLEANVKLLNEITSDESFDQTMKGELDKFKRVCVMNSLAIMKLEMNKTKLDEFKATFKNSEHPHYPILDIQKK